MTKQVTKNIAPKKGANKIAGKSATTITKLPNIQTNAKGERFVTINRKRYIILDETLKNAGMTEREMIIALVKHLTKRKKRTPKKKSHAMPDFDFPVRTVDLSNPGHQPLPPSNKVAITDPGVREYLKLVNLNDASTQRALEEKKVKDDKKKSKEEKKNLLKAQIEHKGKQAELQYTPEDAGTVQDYIRDVEAKASQRGEMKAFETVAEKKAMSSWIKDLGGINKVRGMVNDELPNVKYDKIKKMTAPELYLQIRNLSGTELFNKTQTAFNNAYEKAFKETVRKAEEAVRKAEEEAQLLVDNPEEEAQLLVDNPEKEGDENRPSIIDTSIGDVPEDLFSGNTRRRLSTFLHSTEEDQKHRNGGVGPEGKMQYALGKNRIPKKGLSTQQINELMSHRKSFLGTVPRDRISSLKKYIKPGKTAAFIVNLDPHDKPDLHWVSVVILPKKARVLYFDSFGKPCPEDMRKQIKKLIKVAMPGEIPIFKENLIKVQRANSVNCGAFAMKFIEDTLDGVPFIKATPYDESLAGEKKIRKYIAQLPKFSKI